ncbi:BnaC03g55160D [Brassica napus]|uniref:BnaC03g55160D protein n=2 Tax=Brassica TaxID=3705 RepID=A0A078H0V9_BRANA|nr:BnaC03g55160D [Brassica napus]VDC96800.1 unnamed protein product [Brassica oleracea]
MPELGANLGMPLINMNLYRSLPAEDIRVSRLTEDLQEVYGSFLQLQIYKGRLPKNFTLQKTSFVNIGLLFFFEKISKLPHKLC